MWCSQNAELIDLPPAMPVDRIFGEGIPEKAALSFRGQPDIYGRFDWLDVSRCPLSTVDQLSPSFSSGWLVDVYESVAAISAELPEGWHIQNPSPLLIHAVIALKHEADSAAQFRAENNEDW